MSGIDHVASRDFPPLFERRRTCQGSDGKEGKDYAKQAVHDCNRF